MSAFAIASGIKWLFLDLNSYFASVEQQEYPDLRGEPVAVVPAMTDSTCAIAASYAAKAYGIKTGTKIWEAKKMCPRLRIVPARHDIYVDYHHRILDEIARHIPITKTWSIDEVSCRLPPKYRDIDAARDLAFRIKEGIRKNVGDAITCSIGLAPNSFLAKVASDMQKPDGLTILPSENLPGRLFDLKLDDFPGIGANMLRRLNNAGIYKTENLWNISPKHARKIWGSVAGERFWYNLRGFDVPDLEEGQKRMVGHSRVLDPQLRAPEPARLIARRLVMKAAQRMRRLNLHATTFRLGVRTVDNRKWAAEIRTQAADDTAAFLSLLSVLWNGMIRDIGPTHFRKLSISMQGLREPAQITPDLFDTRNAETVKRHNNLARLSLTMDRLNQRFGANTVSLGTTPATQSGYVGTKIAFSRIPDRAEFCE